MPLPSAGTEPAVDPGYRPEASTTGEVRGPIVPANLPENEILERIDESRRMPNIEQERWWQPNTDGVAKAPLPTWPDVRTKLDQDPQAAVFFKRLSEWGVITGLTSFSSRELNTDFNRVRSRYLSLVQADPATYSWGEDDYRVAERLAAFICYYGAVPL